MKTNKPPDANLANPLAAVSATAIFRKSILSVMALTVVFSILACETSPTGRRQLSLVSDAQLEQMSVSAFAQMKQQTPVSKDAKVNNYVRCIADAITTTLPEHRSWETVVFEDKTANAFALPGGKIGVHTGLLTVAKSQSQLATVIGHEVAHVLANHSKERLSEQLAAQSGITLASILLAGEGNQRDSKYQMAMAAIGLGAQYGLLLPHSRAQESEADILGLDLMAKAGFDPSESIPLWQNMAAQGGGRTPEFMSTHPSHGTRIENLGAHLPQARVYYQQAARKPNCR